MPQEDFQRMIAEEFPNAVPEKFRHLIQNVAFLAEEEPSHELRMLEGLQEGETLLGHYHGMPATARGDHYGIGGTLPDTITLFRIPIESEAAMISARFHLAKEEGVRQVIRDTIWHEVAHHFGYDERQVRAKEKQRRSKK